MKILMLGNSYTFFHAMPDILATLSGAKVVAHTRGGAFLSEHLIPESDLGARTLHALLEQQWDYVVLQEQSRAPIAYPDSFRSSVRRLCELIRNAGATPVLYATWSYREGCDRLASLGLTYNEMATGLHDAYAAAAEENGALLADVGSAFTAISEYVNLYEADDSHPSSAGSVLAAQTIVRVIEADQRRRNG